MLAGWMKRLLQWLRHKGLSILPRPEVQAVAECFDRIFVSALMEPLIVNHAPTGLVPTRARSPHVPLTAEEAVEEFRRTELTVMTILSSSEGLGFMPPDWRSKWGALGLALLATPWDPAWAGNRASPPSRSIFHHHVH